MHQRPVLRPWLAETGGYTPGMAATAEEGRLASNEAPAPPGWLTGLPVNPAGLKLNRYPDATATGLRTTLAETHQVSPEEIVVGNGSDELIMLLVQAYAAYTGSIATAAPGYSLYELCAARLGARVERIPLAGWHYDLVAMAEVAVDIAFVCNPHNPAGTVVDPDGLRTFIDTSAARMIVVDEAYIDFVTEPVLDTVRIAVRDPRVVVLRTFSKAHALAGARVGYVIAHPDIAQTIGRLRLPFSVNALAQAVAARALDHRAETVAAVQEIVSTRLRVEELLRRHGLDFIPSQANFVLILTPESERLVAHLAGHGIAVRPGTDLGVPGAVRLSVPSPAGLDRLEAALAARR